MRGVARSIIFPEAPGGMIRITAYQRRGFCQLLAAGSLMGRAPSTSLRVQAQAPWRLCRNNPDPAEQGPPSPSTDNPKGGKGGDIR
jgi:hypothetical protein